MSFYTLQTYKRFYRSLSKTGHAWMIQVQCRHKHISSEETYTNNKVVSVEPLKRETIVPFVVPLEISF